MKTLELNLNKRLLIVEMTGELDTADVFSWNNQPVEKICKGSDLTEDIAYEMVDGFDLSYFVDYNHHNPRAYKLTAIESFISAIQSKNYHWGENPLENCQWKELEELNAKSRTFNPSKCIIFKLL